MHGFADMRGGRTVGMTLALWVVLASAAIGRDDEQAVAAPEELPTYPALPGEVRRAPAWIGEHTPFDVDRFFAAPPRDQNAAPLYLDALFEFGAEMPSCFPATEERKRRVKEVKDRNGPFVALFQAMDQAPGTISGEMIDGAVAPYEEGFRKLALAQRRRHCVFQTGLGISALLPHAQTARQVARVAQLRVRRALDRGDFPAAIRDVETTLRLARDLQPRGYMINQLVTIAMEIVVIKEMILPILAAPGLKPEHCDRLLVALADDEGLAVDAYAEGLRGEYLTVRVTIEDLVHHQDKIAKELGVEPGGSILSKLAADMTVFSKLSGPGGGAGQPGIAPPLFPKLRNKMIEAGLARMTDGELAAEVAHLNAFYRALFDLGRVPVAERLRRLPEAKEFFGDEPLDRIIVELSPTTAAFTQAVGRQVAHLHAVDCLIALRRWQLGHDAPPPDLLTAVKAAGMPAPPVDPYDGKPMRMALVEGEPVVYSIGKDGVDDGGLIDSRHDSRPGDQLLKLLPPKPAP